LTAFNQKPGEHIRIWELHKSLLPPLVFEPKSDYGSIHHLY
jgi:hypothetical protein